MSLLKRIEKSQQQPGQTPAPGAGAAGGTRPPVASEQSKLAEMRLKRAPTSTSPVRDAYLDLKTRVQNKLLAEMDPSLDVSKTDEVRSTIENLYDEVLAQENIILSRVERQRLFEQIVAEILVFGPIEPFWPTRPSQKSWSTARRISTSNARARSSGQTPSLRATTT